MILKQGRYYILWNKDKTKILFKSTNKNLVLAREKEILSFEAMEDED